MSELNDLPESPADAQDIDLQPADAQDADPQDIDPYDAPWPVDPPVTGDAAVDAALEALAGIHSVPVGEHSDVYVQIHDSLLAALDAEER